MFQAEALNSLDATAPGRAQVFPGAGEAMPPREEGLEPP